MANLPLLVMLPALGLDAAMYAPLARELAGKAELLSFDLPGFDAVAEPFEWSAPGLLARIADGFVQRIRALGRRPQILGGLSLGGTVALSISRTLEAERLLLIAPGGLRVPVARRGAIEAAIAESAPVAFVRRSLGIDAETFEASGLASHFPSGADLARPYFDHLRTVTWHPTRAEPRASAYLAMLRAALDVDLEEEMSTNAIPTDLVWGEEDRVFSRRVRARYAERLRASHLALLPAVGHFPPLEAPSAVAKIVLSRLAEV